MQWTTLGTIGMLAMGMAGACQPTPGVAAPTAEPEASPAEPEASPAEPPQPAPTASGYLEVNGIRLWHEIYGEGPPAIVLPGGLMTIAEMMPLIAPLAKERKVIGVELQGHGHSPDTDRPLALETFGADVAAIIDALQLGPTDVIGYSLGGGTALSAAMQHPDKVRRLVVISNPCARKGWYPEVQQGMTSVNAGLAESMKDTPTAQLAQGCPEPGRFPQFLDRLGQMMGQDYDHCAEVAKLPMPILLAYTDHDSISQRHIADFFALLGGGISEPGWVDTRFTKARLAVIPGYSHYNLMTSTELPGIIERFLATESMTSPGAGAAPASKAAPGSD